MKLTEAVQFRQPLFESQFKDFRDIIEKELPNADQSDLDSLEDTWEDIQNALGDPVDEFGSPDFSDPSFFVKAVRKTVDHPYSKVDLTMIMQEAKQYNDLSRIDGYIVAISLAMERLQREAERPERQDPDYKLIDTGNGYNIYHIRNYSAARSFCNAFNAKHCIGSSNTEWFSEYESKLDAETFAITAKDKLIYVHSGERTFLITSSDNTSEVDGTLLERGGGFDRIVEELRSTGMSIEDVRNALYSAAGSDYEADIDAMLEATMMHLEGKVVYESSKLVISTKIVNRESVISFSNRYFEIEVHDYEPEHVETKINGQFNRITKQDFYITLFRYFGIDGTNIDKIGTSTMAKMEPHFIDLMEYIVDGFE